MKKILTIIISIAMILTFSISIFAQEPYISLISSQEIPSYLWTIGEVLEIRKSDDVTFLTLKPDSEDMGDIVLKIYSDTIIADAHSGLPQSIDEINEGDNIKAYYSSAMTRSLPPQTNAFAILTGLDKEKFSYEYIQVKEVEEKENGDVIVLTKDNSMRITISKENPFKSFKTKDIPSIDAITVDSELLVYYEMVALSYPGQALSLDTIFIRTLDNSEEENNKIVISTEDNHISVDDTVLVFDESEKVIIKDNGDILIPVRKVLEAVGFSVNWNDKDRSVDLELDEIKTSFKIDSNDYTNQKTKSILPKAELIDSKTYVPIQLLNEVLDIDYEVK